MNLYIYLFCPHNHDPICKEFLSKQYGNLNINLKLYLNFQKLFYKIFENYNFHPQLFS